MCVCGGGGGQEREMRFYMMQILAKLDTLALACMSVISHTMNIDSSYVPTTCAYLSVGEPE